MLDTVPFKIESFSKQIAAVKTTDDVLLGVKGLIVGCAFSLMKSHELGFDSNVGSEYPNELDDIAQKIVEAELPERGPWLAGFFFNSALMRIAAGYHILLKRMFGNTDESRKILSEKAIKAGKVHPDDIALLDKIYQDVNDFKHVGAKLLRYRRIATIDEAIEAGQKLISVFGLV
jgi:hypothetical protein